MFDNPITADTTRLHPDVSIIVPVYNVERYINQCLDSIKSQTYTNWECLLVDDGSTDASGKICDEYAQNDSRFKVFHKSNGGLSSARNYGIDHASGDYISFCDSDDWIESEYLQTLTQLMRDYDADIAQVGFWKDFGGHQHIKDVFSTTTVLSKKEAICGLVSDMVIHSYVWNKMYKRSIVSAEFPVGQNFEDIHVNTMWFARINRLVCSNIPLYHYRVRRGSISRKNLTSDRVDFIKSMRFRFEYLDRLYPNLISPEISNTVILKSYINSAKIIARKETDRKVATDVINSFSQQLKSEAKSSNNNLNVKMRFRLWLLCNYPLVFIRVMRVLASLDLHRKFMSKQISH